MARNVSGDLNIMRLTFHPISVCHWQIKKRFRVISAKPIGPSTEIVISGWEQLDRYFMTHRMRRPCVGILKNGRSYITPFWQHVHWALYYSFTCSASCFSRRRISCEVNDRLLLNLTSPIPPPVVRVMKGLLTHTFNAQVKKSDVDWWSGQVGSGGVP